MLATAVQIETRGVCFHVMHNDNPVTKASKSRYIEGRTMKARQLQAFLVQGNDGINGD